MQKPDFLYKYQRLTAHSLAAQLNETVWLAKPSTFNDPFDCALTLSKDSLQGAINHIVDRLAQSNMKEGRSAEPISRAITDSDRAAFEKLRSSLRKIANTIGVLSLAATPSHILMWSHYADQHKGFCVEYDCREGTELRKLAIPVNYLDEYLPLSIEDIYGLNLDCLSSAFFSKAKHWEYEQEWRVLQAEGGRIFAAPAKVTAIIFGAKMSIEDKVMTKMALRSKPWIEFREATLLDGTFDIEIHPFSDIAEPSIKAFGAA